MLFADIYSIIRHCNGEREKLLNASLNLNKNGNKDPQRHQTLCMNSYSYVSLMSI